MSFYLELNYYTVMMIKSASVTKGKHLYGNVFQTKMIMGNTCPAAVSYCPVKSTGDVQLMLTI